MGVMKVFDGRSAFAAAAISLLAGCGGGSHVVPAHGAAQSAGRQTADFVVSVPPRTTAAGALRTPRYVSPATQSIAITVDAGTAQQQTANQNIATGAPNCTTPTAISSLTCTVTLALAPGPHTFDFTTYDQPLTSGDATQGNALSQNLGFPFTIQQGTTNQIPITLQGLPAGIAVLSGAEQDVTGNQSTGFSLVGFYQADGVTPYARTFTVVATDADGNYILGPGAPALTVTSSNPGVLSDGVVAASTNPNAFVVTPGTYGGTQLPLQLQVTATPATSAPQNSGGSALTANVPIIVAARNAPRVFVTDATNNVVHVYDETGHAIGGAIAVGASPWGIAYDPHDGLLYVANNGSNSIQTIDPVSDTATTTTTIADTPYAIAFDGKNDQLYVGVSGAGIAVFNEALQPQAASGSWNESAGGLPISPTSLLYDARLDRVYVLDAARLIQGYDPNGNAVVSWPVATGTYAMAQDPATGVIYLADESTNGVDVYDETGASVPLPGAFAGMSAADGLGWDATSGRLYAVNDSVPTLDVFDRLGNAIATAGTFPGMGTFSNGVAIVP